ncbi:carbon-nitrogen hydrolase [Xylaria sp. CBS 124048]|nr:carbon-nitrogen hydrolase [Xylaria sp. CBS 124048]
MPPLTVPPSNIRLATASPATQSSKQQTMVQLERLAWSAAEGKADFLLLPEAYLGGYPRGSDFGSRVGGRSEAGRDEFRTYFREAVDLGDIVGPAGAGGLGKWVKRELVGDGEGAYDDDDREEEMRGKEGGRWFQDSRGEEPVNKRRGDGTREELERIARETGVFIVVGIVERAGGSLYCAVVYVCPRRGMLGKRRKVMPTGTERLIWAQGSPATLKAVSTTIRGIRVNLAAAICWENYMPLLRQSLYAQNINLYLAPTADGRDTWLPLIRTIGIEGRCFVMSSNMCVRGDAASGGGGGGGGGRGNGARRPQPRRNSCLTEEGFEIALPTSPPKRAAGIASPVAQHGFAKAPRRKSVLLDEDGNEIVFNLGAGPSSDPVNKAVGPSSVVIEEEEEEERDTGGPEMKRYVSRGGSSIVSPFGEVLAGPQWEDDEGIIYADVDLEDCVRGRLDLDAAGSYSRNDSFKFSVEGLDMDPLPYYK